MPPIILTIGRDQSFNHALCGLLSTREIHCEPYDIGLITPTQLAKLRPNLVLLDLTHRKDPVLELLAAIRRDAGLKQIKVIVLTTEGCADVPGLQLADAVWFKPGPIDDLEAKVHELLSADVGGLQSLSIP